MDDVTRGVAHAMVTPDASVTATGLAVTQSDVTAVEPVSHL